MIGIMVLVEDMFSKMIYYFFIQGAFYGIVICGFKNLRVFAGPLPMAVCRTQLYLTAMVLTFCVEFRELSHLTRDLSQAEKKINVVKS